MRFADCPQVSGIAQHAYCVYRKAVYGFIEVHSKPYFIERNHVCLLYIQVTNILFILKVTSMYLSCMMF